ncbi:reverse transcriptase domain, reverse transcriptase zinc-binding domain protein [Tanacetum coccineum]
MVTQETEDDECVADGNSFLYFALALNSAQQDTMRWCDLNGNLSDFAVKYAWEVLRTRGQQDKLRSWDVAASVDVSLLRCPLCGSQQDSHEHLFFECTFSTTVWKSIRNLAGMEHVPPILEDIIVWFNSMGTKRSFKNVVRSILWPVTIDIVGVQALA